MSLRRLASACLGAVRPLAAQQQQLVLGEASCVGSSSAAAAISPSLNGQHLQCGGRLSAASPSLSVPALAHLMQLSPSRAVSTSAAVESPARRSKKHDDDEEEEEPKRGFSGYNVFMKEQFQVVRNALPKQADGKEAPATAVAKEVGKRWHALSEDAKAKYTQLAATHPQNVRNSALKALKKQAAARFTSGYMLFVKESASQYAAKVPADKVGLAKGQATAKLAGEGWRALTEEQRAVYNDKAADIRANAAGGATPE